MEKKKICWITPDYFLIVDAPKVPFLSPEFDIEWILINTFGTKRKTDALVTTGFKPKEYNLKYRQKDPRIILQYLKLIFRIRKLKPDLIYISFHGFPFFFPLFLMFLKHAKIVWGVHNVRTPKGASNSGMMDIYQDYIFRRVRNIHVFSEYQMNLAKKLYPSKKHFLIPLTLEDYGSSAVTPPEDKIRFLFFGYIREYKGLDLLIRSFLELRNEGFGNIELMIAGQCGNWNYYSSMINGEPAIKSRIESIPNQQIPDIVSSCHYVVLPYRDSAQSGVLNLAYQYRKPVIYSDIEALKQSAEDGITGFCFENGSVASLKHIMKQVVLTHKAGYPLIVSKVSEYVEKEFAMDVIIEKYRMLLNECLVR
jgi:glycosyltransferase involved in cell wall biosynthesis